MLDYIRRPWLRPADEKGFYRDAIMLRIAKNRLWSFDNYTKEEMLPAYTEAEVRALPKAATSLRDRALILCLLDTGCRASEFLAWNVEDMNLSVGTVRIRQSKSRRERTVYLGVRARRARLVHAEHG